MIEKEGKKMVQLTGGPHEGKHQENVKTSPPRKRAECT